jgi:hypothetical protein
MPGKRRKSALWCVHAMHENCCVASMLLWGMLVALRSHRVVRLEARAVAETRVECALRSCVRPTRELTVQEDSQPSTSAAAPQHSTDEEDVWQALSAGCSVMSQFEAVEMRTSSCKSHGRQAEQASVSAAAGSERVPCGEAASARAHRERAQGRQPGGRCRWRASHCEPAMCSRHCRSTRFPAPRARHARGRAAGARGE